MWHGLHFSRRRITDDGRRSRAGVFGGGRGAGSGPEGGLLAQYVNDRPYAASSFLSVALSRVFGSAMGSHSEARPELTSLPIPLTARITPLDCRGGLEVAERL